VTIAVQLKFHNYSKFIRNNLVITTLARSNI